MGSTVPTFKAALITALEAATWPEDPAFPGAPQICYGPPRNSTRQDVIVGDTAQEGGAERDWAALGNRQIEEQYDLNLLVTVTTPGRDCKEATERAFALFDVIQAVCRETPGMGVAGVFISHLAQPEHTESTADEGFVCDIDSAIRVQARI